jgi:hypothetical protein
MPTTSQEHYYPSRRIFSAVEGLALARSWIALVGPSRRLPSTGNELRAWVCFNCSISARTMALQNKSRSKSSCKRHKINNNKTKTKLVFHTSSYPRRANSVSASCYNVEYHVQNDHTKRLFDLFASCYKSHIYEGGDGYARNCKPSKGFNELKRKAKQIDPDSANISPYKLDGKQDFGEIHTVCIRINQRDRVQ